MSDKQTFGAALQNYERSMLGDQTAPDPVQDGFLAELRQAPNWVNWQKNDFENGDFCHSFGNSHLQCVRHISGLSGVSGDATILVAHANGGAFIEFDSQTEAGPVHARITLDPKHLKDAGVNCNDPKSYSSLKRIAVEF